MGANALRTMIVDREKEGPAAAMSLIRTRERFELPPPHPHADRHELTTIAGTPVQIDTIGAEREISWIQTGNLYTLSAVDRSAAELVVTVEWIMQWYQRKR